MKIIMTKDEVIHAFLNSVKVRDAVLSYHGACNHEGVDVAIEGEENYSDDEDDNRTQLTRDCLHIMANWKKKDYSTPIIPCIKRIRDITDCGLREAKIRFDAWKANNYKGNV